RASRDLNVPKPVNAFTCRVRAGISNGIIRARMKHLPVVLGLAVVLAGCASPSAPPPRAEISDLPGHRPDGSILLPNQWSLRPAGKQVVVGDFPVNIALHPAGHHAAVLHSGFGQHEVVILGLPGGAVVSRANLEESFYGIQFSPDGKQLYC